MEAKDVMKTGAKSAAEVAANLRNPEEPIEPISERVSHLTPRGEEFNRDREPIEPVENLQVEPEALTVEEMLVMEDDELASYGIDDPSRWKSYQRLLNKKETEWSKEKNAFERTISDLKNGRREPSNQEPFRPEPLQPAPVAPVVKPIKPLRPATYDVTEALTDVNSVSAQYMNNMEVYRTAYDAYQIDRDARIDARIDKLTGYVANEQQKTIQANKREAIKSKSLAQFQTRGLNAKEATTLFDQIEQAYSADPETGADIFVNLFKNGTNGSEQNPKPRESLGRRKLPDNIIMPPGVGTSTVKPVTSESNKFMKSIEGANQSRKIILNRTGIKK